MWVVGESPPSAAGLNDASLIDSYLETVPMELSQRYANRPAR